MLNYRILPIARNLTWQPKTCGHFALLSTLAKVNEHALKKIA